MAGTLTIELRWWRPARTASRLRRSHSYEPYERRANRLAAKYFSKNYGVNWLSPYPNSNSPWTIADYYPL